MLYGDACSAAALQGHFISRFAMAFFIALAGWLFVVGSAVGQESQQPPQSSYPRARLLVDSDELSQEIDSDNLVLLDARPAKAYSEGHLPNARWVDHGDWAKTFQKGEGTAAWQKKIGALGIDAKSKIVVYDDNVMKDAARIWWILRYWGVEDARLLNGGWKEWETSKLPIVTRKAAVPIKPRDYTVKTQKTRLALKDDLLSSLPGQQWQIVDARSFDEHCGIRALGNERSGAIPGAKHLEWSDLIDLETHRFRSPAELTQLFAKANVDLRRPTATHCQSGGRASVMAFGLELMGADEVRNYYRGWSEWGNAKDTPIETDAKKPSP